MASRTLLIGFDKTTGLAEIVFNVDQSEAAQRAQLKIARTAGVNATYWRLEIWHSIQGAVARADFSVNPGPFNTQLPAAPPVIDPPPVPPAPAEEDPVPAGDNWDDPHADAHAKKKKHR